MSPTIAPPPLNTPVTERNGYINPLWGRFYVDMQQTVTTAFAPIDASYWTSTTNATLTNEQNIGALATGILRITTGAGIAVPSTTTTISATTELSGTIQTAQFPATLPALSGVNLTDLNATQLTSGTVPDGRFPATLPALNGSALTSLTAANLTGTIPNGAVPNPLPAVSGIALTALSASALTGALPAISGAALTALSSSALTGALPALSGAALTAITGANVTHSVVTKVAADSPYTVLASDETILVNAVAGAVTVTLPTPTSGRVLCVKKTDASANLVTLTGTVDTLVNPTLGTQFQSRVIQADGTGWQILAGYL